MAVDEGRRLLWLGGFPPNIELGAFPPEISLGSRERSAYLRAWVRISWLA